MKRATVLALAAASAALALSACGGTSSTTTLGGPASQSSSTTAGSPAPTTGTTGTPTTTTEIKSTPACVASALSLSYLGGQGATGHGELGFALKNTGSTTCHTYGYPGVLFLSKAGQGLTTATTRTTHDFFGVEPETRIAVAPGQSVSFRLGVTHGAASSAKCATAYGLQVIPPDDTATLKTSIPNGGAFECGTTTVSPLRPGTTAYP